MNPVNSLTSILSFQECSSVVLWGNYSEYHSVLLNKMHSVQVGGQCLLKYIYLKN